MKSSFQIAVLAPVVALLSACAVPDPAGSQGQQLARADGPQSDVVCFFEAATGTNRKVRRCMSKDEYNRGMESAQRLGNEIKIPPPPPQ